MKGVENVAVGDWDLAIPSILESNILVVLSRKRAI